MHASNSTPHLSLIHETHERLENILTHIHRFKQDLSVVRTNNYDSRNFDARTADRQRLCCGTQVSVYSAIQQCKSALEYMGFAISNGDGWMDGIDDDDDGRSRVNYPPFISGDLVNVRSWITNLSISMGRSLLWWQAVTVTMIALWA